MNRDRTLTAPYFEDLPAVGSAVRCGICGCVNDLVLRSGSFWCRDRKDCSKRYELWGIWKLSSG